MMLHYTLTADMKVQFLFFLLNSLSFGGELPANWQNDWPNFLKTETLQNQQQYFPLVNDA